MTLLRTLQGLSSGVDKQEAAVDDGVICWLEFTDNRQDAVSGAILRWISSQLTLSNLRSPLCGDANSYPRRITPEYVFKAWKHQPT